MATRENDIHEIVQCSICLDVMHNVMTVSPCAHKFCTGCILEWKKDNRSCPKCRWPIVDLTRDSSFCNIIEYYLKEFPKRRRSEEDLSRLDKLEINYLKSMPSILRERPEIWSSLLSNAPDPGSAAFTSYLEMLFDVLSRNTTAGAPTSGLLLRMNSIRLSDVVNRDSRPASAPNATADLANVVTASLNRAAPPAVPPVLADSWTRPTAVNAAPPNAGAASPNVHAAPVSRPAAPAAVATAPASAHGVVHSFEARESATGKELMFGVLMNASCNYDPWACSTRITMNEVDKYCGAYKNMMNSRATWPKNRLKQLQKEELNRTRKLQDKALQKETSSRFPRSFNSITEILFDDIPTSSAGRPLGGRVEQLPVEVARSSPPPFLFSVPRQDLRSSSVGLFGEAERRPIRSILRHVSADRSSSRPPVPPPPTVNAATQPSQVVTAPTSTSGTIPPCLPTIRNRRPPPIVASVQTRSMARRERQAEDLSRQTSGASSNQNVQATNGSREATGTAARAAAVRRYANV
ncbi:unnamed protein product [Caenorhabditis auriculariae]|uniref:RING-type domain-containing protein n=1 Tax=Caenorhabditis auriculariae TaxID=2777116 RepID=A0A8S1GVD2_9PELO|nr:unnamed protein product [Caenorhabditis auriculariae]